MLTLQSLCINKIIKCKIPYISKLNNSLKSEIWSEIIKKECVKYHNYEKNKIIIHVVDLVKLHNGELCYASDSDFPYESDLSRCLRYKLYAINDHDNYYYNEEFKKKYIFPLIKIYCNDIT